ncbi:MAG: MGMT family protein [Candidatus Liptonbacteria bacterium]|nr:MGMT family protein [Candidatus Liptonbacteria bacterium]
MRFKEKVLEVVRRIPKGSVMSYKEVAVAAGSPRAYRAVGNIMKANRDREVPCHRVIRSDGRPGGYSRGGSSKKIERLKKEGVELR